MSEGKKALDAARGARGMPVTLATRPERFVVEKPPPEPDYPRYRVEPGTAFRLSDVDPGETEHYRGKKDVRQQLEAQRGRIAELQERLYAENRQGLLIVLQAMDPGADEAPATRCARLISRGWCPLLGPRQLQPLGAALGEHGAEPELSRFCGFARTIGRRA